MAENVLFCCSGSIGLVPLMRRRCSASYWAEGEGLCALSPQYVKAIETSGPGLMLSANGHLVTLCSFEE